MAPGISILSVSSTREAARRFDLHRPSLTRHIHILQIPKDRLLDIPHVSSMMTDTEIWTTMLLGHSCRVVMGPCRGGELLSIVALVPDG